ncbi:hypothetical protein EGW08_016082 [Elysia chlorotica]|uniref:Short-chain dehydrogenase/reductase 3 n=1 Tax=Elysia chlorotica TaxID=188477 RepID=A0A433T3S5_ELYCH|nr:hypothetical protein EGW08_016082 [Elysia chlorotica]
MNLVAESLALVGRVTWLWLAAVYRAVAPVGLQSRKDVTGWLALVTGAGSGVGRLLALRFAHLGCRVVLWDVNQEGNQATADLIKEAVPGAQVWTYTVDLARRDNIYTAAKQVKSELGDVNILVNNAGIITGCSLLDNDDHLNIKTMEVNALSHLWAVKCFLPGMLRRNRGHVVTVASTAGLFGVPGMVDYSVSKFSAVGLSECLRMELIKRGKTGVKTTVVCPGYIDTGMFRGFKYRFPLLMQELKPTYVADKIIEAVQTDQQMLCLPRMVYMLLMIKGIVPVSVCDALAEFTGVLNTMDDFVGRKND